MRIEKRMRVPLYNFLPVVDLHCQNKLRKYKIGGYFWQNLLINL